MILGVPADIAVPTYLNQRVAVWRATVISDVHNAARQVELASYDKNSSITGPADDQDSGVAKLNGGIGEVLNAYVHGHGSTVKNIGKQPVTLNPDNGLTILTGSNNGYIVDGSLLMWTKS